MAVPVLACQACSAQDSSEAWYKLSTAATVSTAPAGKNDLAWQWTAPDGRSITARIRQPQGDANGPTVTLVPPPPGTDSRPAFESVIATAKARHARIIVIPAGRYLFQTSESNRNAHWLINGLKDVVIEGNGATLVFANNADGIAIRASQRIELKNLTLDYALRTWSLATLVDQAGAAPILKVDAGSPVTADDRIGHITEFDRATSKVVPNGVRVYTPSTSDYRFIGGQGYSSPKFSKSMIGKSFLVYHHYYGGVALKIQDDQRSGADRDEDITIRQITIRRSPGIGVLIYGPSRGVAIIDSHIEPAPGEFVSSEYDAIYVQQAGGDIAIMNSTIDRAGDDNINLGSPVSPVITMADSGKFLILGMYSRLMQSGDTLAAFDGQFSLLGTARITEAPTPLGGLNYAVKLDRSIPGIDASSFIRDVALMTSRVIIANNTISNGGDALIQAGNVFVSKNRFNNTGVRILSNLGPFKEGMGGMNVAVADNTFTGGRTVFRYGFPHAAITAYGLNSKTAINENPVNIYVDIRNNVISNVPLSCISIASTSHVTISGNTCIDTNRSDPTGFDIHLMHDRAVTLTGNHVSSSRGTRVVNSSGVQQ